MSRRRREPLTHRPAVGIGRLVLTLGSALVGLVAEEMSPLFACAALLVVGVLTIAPEREK